MKGLKRAESMSSISRALWDVVGSMLMADVVGDGVYDDVGLEMTYLARACIDNIMPEFRSRPY